MDQTLQAENSITELDGTMMNCVKQEALTNNDCESKFVTIEPIEHSNNDYKSKRFGKNSIEPIRMDQTLETENRITVVHDTKMNVKRETCSNDCCEITIEPIELLNNDCESKLITIEPIELSKHDCESELTSNNYESKFLRNHPIGPVRMNQTEAESGYIKINDVKREICSNDYCESKLITVKPTELSKKDCQSKLVKKEPIELQVTPDLPNVYDLDESVQDPECASTLDGNGFDTDDNTKDDIKKSKFFVDYDCQCSKKCADLIPREQRTLQFITYANLKSSRAQELFICNFVKQFPKKTTSRNASGCEKKVREFNRIYYLADTRVCREMFVNTLQISSHKVTSSLKNMYHATGKLNLSSIDEFLSKESSSTNNDFKHSSSNLDPIDLLLAFDVVESAKEHKRLGRKIKYGNDNRYERCVKKYSNKPYVTSKNRHVNAKVFMDYACNCTKKCRNLVPRDVRESVFNTYVHLGSYSAQTKFILESVKQFPKKRCYSKDAKGKFSTKREFSREYYLGGTKVCKEMYLNTLQMNQQKVTHSLKKMKEGSHLTDERGKHGGWNRTSPEDVQYIMDLIDRICRSSVEDGRDLSKDILPVGMTIKRLYEIYKEEWNEKYNGARKCISYSTMKFFVTKFKKHVDS